MRKRSHKLLWVIVLTVLLSFLLIIPVGLSCCTECSIPLLPQPADFFPRLTTPPISSIEGGLTDADIAALQQQAEKEGWTFTVDKNDATQYSLNQLCGLVEPDKWWETATFDPCEPKRSLPERLDWREIGNGITPIRNQGPCGSCWAFATAAPLESNIKIQDGISVDLSEQWLVSCNREGWGCQGGWWAHNYYQWKGDPCGGTGAVLEQDFPYVAWNAPCNCPYPHSYWINNWAYVGSGSGVPPVSSMKQAIMQYGPIAVAVTVNHAFQAYTSGVFNAHTGAPVNHGVALIGWDDNYYWQGNYYGVWILRNSWGPNWGEAGYMYITYGTSRIGHGATYVNYIGQAQKLQINLPDEAPKVITPDQPTTITVQLDQTNESYVPGSGFLHYRINGGDYQTSPLVQISGDIYQATLPTVDCGTVFDYYFTAEGAQYGSVSNPRLAPYVSYNALVQYLFPVLVDDFETDKGWTVVNCPSLTAGAWERGIPAGDGSLGDPPFDYDGSGQCYVTGIQPGVNVDGGTTWLISPTLNLSVGVDGYIQYYFWYTNYAGSNPHSDVFTVWISNDNAETWTLVTTFGPETSPGWKKHEFRVGDYVPVNDKIKVRFEASDLGEESIVEAGIDAFAAYVVDCRKPPYIPRNPSPAHESTGVDLHATLSWDGGDPNPGEIITYDVYFGETNPPPLVASNHTETVFDPGTLTLWTNYYWKIVAWDNTSETPPTYGPIWEFRSIDPIEPEWRNQAQSSDIVQAGGSVELSSEGRDNIGLKAAYISTNETGEWLRYDGAGWWNDSWDFSKQVVIDHTKVIDDLTDFPVLLTCTSPDFIAHAQPSGNDFVFVDATNTTVFNHEIEYYNSETGQLVAWVQIPFLNSSDDTILYLYYGNPECENQENVQDTWNDGFIAVYHMTGADYTDLYDSTHNNYDITFKGGTPMFNQPGVVGRSVRFKGAGDYLQSNVFRLPANTSYTASAWVYVDGGHNTRREVFSGIFPAFYVQIATNNSVLNLARTNVSAFSSHSHTVIDSANPEWHYIVSRVNTEDNTVALLINGVMERNVPFTGELLSEDLGLNIGTRHNPNTAWMRGRIDEIRFSAVARSDAWIKTEYNNIISPPTFASFGTEQDRGGGSKHGSPHMLSSSPDEWVWTNFTWQNPEIPDGTIIGWQISYVDLQGNRISTDIKSFSVGSFLQLEGYCYYEDMVPVNDVQMKIQNLDTGMSWTAETTLNSYSLGLIPGVDIDVGHTLRYIARDQDHSLNVTDHMLTINDFQTGILSLDFVINIHYRDLKNFPFYVSQVDTGAMVMKQILDFLRWNSTAHPDGPPNVYSEQDLYDTYRDYLIFPELYYDDDNVIDEYQLAFGLNHEIRHHFPLPEWYTSPSGGVGFYGYFFSAHRYDTALDALKSAGIWLDYNVSGHNDIRTIPVPQPGHTYHVPVAVPTGGNYDNWMVIRGIHTNRSFWDRSSPGYHQLITGPVSLYGFWVTDSSAGGIGANWYMTTEYFIDTYFEPMAVGINEGQYVMVVDPPENMPSIETSNVVLTPEKSRGFTSIEQTLVNIGLQRTGLPYDRAIKTISTQARRLVERVLIHDSLYRDSFTASVAVGQPIFEGSVGTIVFSDGSITYEVSLDWFSGTLLRFSVNP